MFDQPPKSSKQSKTHTIDTQENEAFSSRCIVQCLQAPSKESTKWLIGLNGHDLCVPYIGAACMNTCAWLSIPPFEGTFETSESEYSKNKGGGEQNWPCRTFSQKMMKLLRPLLARCYDGRSKKSNKEHGYARECGRSENWSLRGQKSENRNQRKLHKISNEELGPGSWE